MRHAVRAVHFVGLGGAGMSGIAEVLHQQGYRVSGSDLHDSAILRRLQGLGLGTRVGHDAANVAGADVVVASSAIAQDNPELVRARHDGIPIVARAEMLAELMRARSGIAVAGTHGKTTTTGLVTSVLEAGGLQPGFVIGGELLGTGKNADNGRGEWLVAEADESDASFLHLQPMMAVITNIDADHMDTYGHSLARLHEAFVAFVHRMPFYGRAIVCLDDPGVRSVLPRLQRPVIGYGIESSDAPVRALALRAEGARMHFTVQRQFPGAQAALRLSLNLAGRHNVLNALAAVAVAGVLGIGDDALRAALSSFRGVGRRFQSHGEIEAAQGGRYLLLEDYGHHPVEIGAVLAAARSAFEGRRIVIAFQPHRYTRTRDCLAGFAQVLARADRVLLTEVYAAGEEPIAGADAAALGHATGRIAGVQPGFAPDIDALCERIAHEARDGDVVICMGAGSIGQVPARLARARTQGGGA